MYVSHAFSRFETLSRARYWLDRLGFDPSQVEACTDGIPRISVNVKDAAQYAEAELLFAALESSEPDGWPSLWELARRPHVYPASVARVEVASDEHPGAIHWQPLDWGPRVLETAS
jgi:hypothetical protein